MTYSIIGSGAIGGALAKRFAEAGVDALIANSRGPETLSEIVGASNGRLQAVPLDEALGADVVILAVPFDAVSEAVKGAKEWNGRVVVDATNAIKFPEFKPADLQGRASTDIVAEAVPGARVVKAFNTLPAAVLASDPREGKSTRVVFLSGNDPDARRVISSLIFSLKFAPVDLGSIAQSLHLQQFGSPLVGPSFLKQA
ncbi:NADPH-dependent F420 reductase [Rhizobium halophilum]|uniref:NADPH-dependent F420 reductase n=1 Tax=Rhizobium halophilum TaxID=2846852 RepID=UPI001EFE9B04|nr:NADPH-dependent F420 reductase [Rhizobium halophilum]MCF6371294.1 NADPH-dependent F420 reductase [Rhizobium halophilum]